MIDRMYLEIELSEIQPNPWNPRKNFSGPKYDELKASIASKGVLEPILVRRIPDKGPADYEIIAGERRFRAARDIAESNGGSYKIPAIIQDMTDDEAFDVMTIENLQREDLTELEEARSFQTYLKRKGKDALPELAERVGIHPRYITRRVAVLSLPENVLQAWEEDKIKYGHCEQLARLGDHKAIKEYADRIIKPQWGEPMTVRQLRAHIDDKSIELSWAKFDREKEGCLSCHQNSDVQKELFGEGMEKTHCLNPACFRKKQRAWLTKNWKKFAKAVGTNVFRFERELNYDAWEKFSTYSHGDPGEKCAECPDFVSIVTLRGKFAEKQVCTGDKKCFQSVTRKKQKKESSAGVDGETKDDGPRGAWHGEYFREAFYKTRLPEVWKELKARYRNPPGKMDPIVRLAIMSILISNRSARVPFACRHIPKHAGKENLLYDFNISTSEIWQAIEALSSSPDALLETLRNTALDVYMQKESGSDRRHEAAVHLGIDLAKEWRLNQEYLDKKTIKEIHEICEKFGIFADEKAKSFLHETLGKKRGKFNTCKKDELIRIILESGVDLAGKVPDEILDVKISDAGIAFDDESDPDFPYCGKLPIDDDGICQHLRDNDCGMDCCRQCDAVRCNTRCAN